MRGPAPKDPAKRVRRNATASMTTVPFVPAAQPPLPKGKFRWPARTVAWWKMWRDSPLSERFTAADWDFLLDTAILHAAVWGAGNIKALPELRIRVAKFGQTPEDRARLRIQFAEADKADGPERTSSSRKRRGPLKSDGVVIDAVEAFSAR